MEYENIDKAITYQDSCRKVKQMAEAIKKLRIKYYPNFTKISEEDKQIYDELNNQMEKTANENGLNGLKSVLISEISERYSGQIPSADGQENTPQNKKELYDKALIGYYGAIDAGKQILSEGKLKKAIICQRQAEEYMQILQKGGQEYVNAALNYKRGKFAELTQSKEKTNWSEVLPNYFRKEDAQKRDEITKEFADIIKQKEEPEKIETYENVMR